MSKGQAASASIRVPDAPAVGFGADHPDQCSDPSQMGETGITPHIMSSAIPRENPENSRPWLLQGQVEGGTWVSVIRGTAVKLPRKFCFLENEGPSCLWERWELRASGVQPQSPMCQARKGIWLASAASVSDGAGTQSLS